MMKSLIAVVFFLMVYVTSSYGQHTEDANKHPNVEDDGMIHKVTVVLANSFLKNQFDESANNVLVVPTYGLNYDALFHHRWGVGIHSDVVLQQYKVEKHDSQEELVRENPVAVCGVGLFKPTPNLILLAGYGVEIENHGNIPLIRFGIEYEIHLPKNWELEFALEFDRKLKSYNSWVFGVGFSKLFMKRSQETTH